MNILQINPHGYIANPFAQGRLVELLIEKVKYGHMVYK